MSTGNAAQSQDHRSFVGISAGGEHTLALSRAGSVMSWGACGLGYLASLTDTEALAKSLRPKRLTIAGGDAFAQLAAGSYHNLAVTRVGKLYSWGCGVFTTGQNDGSIPALGQPSAAEATTPQPVAGLEGETVTAAAAGGYHSVALTASGRVLTWGAGQLGQLGRPTPAGLTDSAGLPVDNMPQEMQMGDDDQQSDCSPAAVGASFYNTYVVCRDGGLLCSGENQNRQCGAGPANLHSAVPVGEAAKQGIRAVEVVGGYCHTLIRDSQGAVFSMGCGEDGQRGSVPAADQQHAPLEKVELPNGARAAQVAAGLNHSLCLSTDGRVFGWGSNEYGQLGLEGLESSSLPKEVPVQGRMVRVGAGSTHSILLTEDGSIHTMGNGGNGQLGNWSDGDWETPGPQPVKLQPPVAT